MVLTVLEAHIPPGRETDLQSAFAAALAKGDRPAGLVHTELLRDARDPTRWRLQTRWTSREALEAMRSAGTPAGVLMFRAAGAEPVLSLFDVMCAL